MTSKSESLREYLEQPTRKRLEKVVEAYHRFVWSVAFRVSGNRQDAEDICQDVFLKLLLRPPRPHEIRSAKGFLSWRVLQRADALRQAARRRLARERVVARRAAENGLPADDLEVLHDAIGGLPEELRTPVELRYLAAMGGREVAEILGVSEQAISQRLTRARSILKRRLAPLVPALLALTNRAEGSAATPPPPDLLPDLLRIAEMGSGLAPAAAGATVATWTGIGTGGVVMSVKKLAISIGVAVALLVAGGVFLIGSLPGDRDETVTARGAGTVTSPGGTAGRSVAVDEPVVDVRETEESPVADEPVSILGSITSSGDPIAGALVIAIHLDAWSAIEAQNGDNPEPGESLRQAYGDYGKTAPRTNSGDDGRYVLRALGDGDYRLVAVHARFLPNVDCLATTRTGHSTRRDIELVAGEKISGRVIDENGAPVAGALVRAEESQLAALKGRARDLERLREWQRGKILVDTSDVKTVEDGSFELNSLELANYRVTARKSGHLEEEVWDVAAGALDLVLTLRRGTSLRGRIVDHGGQPVRGAGLLLRPGRTTEVHRFLYAFEMPMGVETAEELRAVTLADGSFLIDGLEEGDYDLTASVAGAAPLREEIEIAGRVVDLGDVQLEESRSIAGTVHAPDGQPLEGARVWAGAPVKSVRSAGNLGVALPEAMVEATSGAGGRFVLDGLPPGQFELWGVAAGFAANRTRDVESGTTDARLTLERGIAVHGSVVDERTLRPVPGAEVKIGFGGRAKTTGSDGAGNFSIEGLSYHALHHGRTTVTVSHPDYGRHRDQFSVLGRDPKTPLEVRLTSTRRITGRVIDSAGRPVRSAHVWIEVPALRQSGYYSAARHRTLAAADGSFLLHEPGFLRNLSADNRPTIVVSHPAHAPTRVGPLELPGTGESWPDFDIVLTSGATLEGRITTVDGAPVAGARITVRSASVDSGTGALQPELTARVGYAARDGRYRIAALEPRSAVVEVTALGHARTVVGVEIGDAVSRRDFVLTPGGSIQGRVVDSEGAPVIGAEAVAFAGADESTAGTTTFERRMQRLWRAGIASTRCRDDGRFQLTDLPAGEFTVVARAAGYEAGEAVSIPVGSADVNLTLSRFAAILGTVIRADSRRIVPSFDVHVIDLDKRNARTGPTDWRVGSEGELTFTDPLGRFVYDGLRGGDYEVVVGARGYLAYRKEIRLGPGEELPLEIALHHGATIAGVVIDTETGEPVAGVEVSCFRQPSKEEMDRELRERGYVRARSAPPSGRATAYSTGTGKFELDGLIDGQYALFASHPYYRLDAAYSGARKLRSSLLQLAAADSERVELRVAPTGRLEGAIQGLTFPRTEASKVFYSVTMERLDKASPQRRGRHGDLNPSVTPQGRFQTEGVPPGRYRLTLERQELREAESTQTTPGGGNVILEPVGAARKTPLGEVEIRAHETTVFEFTVE